MTEKLNQTLPEPNKDLANKRPNETGSISVEGFVKIYDPKSQQVFVEQRA
jgi:hypothetical protein